MPARPLRSLASALAAVLFGALVLTGCGGEEEPVVGKAKPVAQGGNGADGGAESAEPYAGMEPKEVLALAGEKVAQAKTVQAKSVYNEDGGAVKYSLQLSRAGRGRGTLSTPADGSMKVMVIGDDLYYQPGKDMLKKISSGDQPTFDALRGRWMHVPRGSDMDDMFDVMDMQWFINDFVDLSKVSGTIERVKGKTIAGRETVGFRGASEPGTVYVAADGSGEMLGFVHPDGRVVFSNWNKKFKVKAPADPLSEKDLSTGNF